MYTIFITVPAKPETFIIIWDATGYNLKKMALIWDATSYYF
jgi:hypothetical protein